MSRPWIEHDGSGCPLKRGTKVEVFLRNGVSSIGRIGDYVAIDSNNNIYTRRSDQGSRGSCWVWSTVIPGIQILKYRVLNDPQAETETRARRENQWHDWRKEAEKLADPLPHVPEKVSK